MASGQRSQRASGAQLPSRAQFDERCRVEEVSTSDLEPLWELLCRWRWRASEDALDELAADYREHRLYQQSRGGDSVAAREFERRWRDYARRSLGWRLVRPDVDELIAVFFERVYRLIRNQHHWRSPFTVYLRTILVNLARARVNRIVKTHSREVSMEDLHVAEVVARRAAPQPTPEEQALQEERRRTLEAAFHELAPVERNLLWASLVDGRAPDELAAVLGTSREAIYKRIQRAKSRLARRLTELGCVPR